MTANATTEPESPFEQALAQALALREGDGTLHLTLSFLIHHGLIKAVLPDSAAARWNRELLGRLAHGSDYQDTRRLGRAIEPLFNDIADRQRGLFVEDFLLDTPSLPVDPGLADADNICGRVVLQFPAGLHWKTEGRASTLRIAEPVALQATCRAFWVAHSNTSLSYHLSLQLPYAHDHRHYYALSLLQKAVFSSEQTDWLQSAAEGGLRVRDADDGAGDWQSFYQYVRTLFESHAGHLLGRVAGEPGDAAAPQLAKDGLWRRLLVDPAMAAASERDPTMRDDARMRHASLLGNLQCRALLLLEDPYFFALLGPDVRTGLSAFTEVAAAREDGGDNPRNRYDEAALLPARLPPAELDYYFLSGFLQNIIDFLRQDVSEIQDGTDPIYPPAGTEDEGGHFLVYATQTSIYEVVARSRSLGVGRAWIGTCPYLFLVHLMTMHNESLVQEYERMVRALIGRMGTDRLLDAKSVDGGAAYASEQADEAFKAFRRFRLDTFEKVAKHRYFNVLRYDTERQFYEAIETVRGIQQREAYWASVVSDLEKTVDDLRENESKRSEQFLNRVLFYVTFLGVLQILFQLIDFGVDGQWRKFRLGIAASIAITLVMLLLLNMRGLTRSGWWRPKWPWRRGGRSP